MRKIELADYKLGLIRIHLDGVSFYRTAYERNKTIDNKEKMLTVAMNALQQIEELVNGKSTS